MKTLGRLMTAGGMLAALASVATPAHAQITTEDILVYEAHAFRNVVEEDDLLVLIRYQLPTADWQNATYMVEPTCTDENDITDRCYTSLVDGAAQQTLKDDTGAVVTARDIPRIRNGLSALRLCGPGSTDCLGQDAGLITWGDPDAETCLLGPSSLSPQPETCVSIIWHDSDSIADNVDVLLPVLQAVMLNLEREDDVTKNSYVSNNLITEVGSSFAREALTGIILIVPEAFANSVISVARSFTATAVPGTNLNAAITTPERTKTVYVAFNRVGQSLGVNGAVFGSFVFLFIAAVAFGVFLRRMPGQFSLAAYAGFLLLALGAWFGIMPWAAVIVSIIVVNAIGVGKYIRDNLAG